jgi:hypothetical protein
MTEAALLFDAVFEGQLPQRFVTLQNAMNWVEDLDRPTGTISFEGGAIIRYTDGNATLAR